MSTFTAPRFEKRGVQQWLRLAEEGVVALPSFQRSYVWKRNQAIADYLLAVFENRPTGVFLMLKTNGKPQFPSRTLKGIKSKGREPQELLLDGQQRLTSLWHAFNGTAAVSYYVNVESFEEDDIAVCDIVFWSDRSATGRAMRDPRNAYAAKLVPVDILPDRLTAEDGLGQIWQWCEKAVRKANAARRLERSISSLRSDLLFQRELHYCELEADTEPSTAIDIFVQSNKSSVKVNEFDIAVALALEGGEENLRERISDFHQQSEVTSHYFNVGEDDEEAVIAPLGEWVLFAACLSVRGVAPKKQRFEAVIKDVFDANDKDTGKRLESLLMNVEEALNTLGDHGVPTRDTLPVLPPLHVLAGLQEDLKGVKKAGAIGIRNRLISAYLWRSFLTDRYEAKANDRLFEDFKGLRECIRELREIGTFDTGLLPPVFNEEEYPLPDAAMLGSLKKPIPWIKGTPRLGRAIAAITLHQAPTDWVTSDKLDARRVREWARARRLDRHHVFSRNILSGEVPKEAIHHGLNGVLLSKPANQALSKKDPTEYMTWILDQPKAPREDELRRRVESHLVPYDIITAEGSVKERYEAFIKARAESIEKRIRDLSALPGV